MNDPWDDDVLYSPDPPEHGARCPYGHLDASGPALGYCRAEASRMLAGLRRQRDEKLTAGDMVRVRHLGRAIAQWEARLA